MLVLSRFLPLLALLAVTPAFANDALLDGSVSAGSGGYSNEIHGLRLDVHGNLDGWGVFGVGVPSR